MAEFKLPDLGENISQAGVVSVLVKEGDTIEPDTPVLEIETDKATLEVPSSVGGRVSKIHVKPGEKAKVGQVVLTFEESKSASSKATAPAGAGEKKGAATPDRAETPDLESRAGESAKSPAGSAAGRGGSASGASASGRASGGQNAGGASTGQSGKKAGPVDVPLPFLGDGIHEATILNILVKPGDKIETETPVLEIETDKATVEVPGGVAGTVKEVHVKSGDKAKVGQKLLVVEGTSGGAQPAEQAPQQQNRPVEEQKARLPLEVPTTPRFKLPKSGNGAAAPPAHKPAPASPTVRRLAREIGVDINQVKGSGPRGRISHEDVKAHARALLKGRGGAAVPAIGAPQQVALPLPDFSKFGNIRREPMTTIRQKTAQQMGLAWSTIPMVTQFDKADVTDLEKLRQKLDVKAKKQGNKLTVTAILVKVIASALKRFPKFNASIDLMKQEVVFKEYFHIGIAVDTERGLLVPVLKDVQNKNIFEISADLQTIAEKARNRKVTPDDLSGSCFTITNLGGVGGTAFTPIVNPPEVAILGVSRSSVEPVWDEQESGFVPRTLLPLSLSYDHRLIDGAEAARFLRFVCEALENPALLLFEG